MLDEILAKIAVLPEKEKQAMVAEVMAATKDAVWIPNPGPQTEGYFSKADVLLFGGNPGGGKSGLEIGLALTAHYRSLIVRKNFNDLEGLIDNTKKMLGTDDGFVGGNRPKYRKPDGGVIHYAGLPEDGGIGGHQGVDHDLLCVDEAAQIPENQVRLMMAWVRSDRPGQRCRTVLASNPPLDSTGDWLIAYFAPWLDEQHPNPAKPGELRYFLPDPRGGDRECEQHETAEIQGVTVYPQSRTYIPSKFTDNPYYDPQQYAKSLAGLGDQQRDILISGNFMLSRKQDPNQLIRIEWVKAAQARWTQDPPQGIPMCAIGVDVAQGGDDNNVIAYRHDGWFGELEVVPGSATPLGTDIGGEVIKRRRDGAVVVLDCGGGYGGAAFKNLKENSIEVMAYVGSHGSMARTEPDRLLGFSNKRTEAWWRMREALDPGQPGGSRIALPPDAALLSDLTSPRYEVRNNQIVLETKKDLVKRIGRSPDRGDAVVMAWSVGPKISTSYGQWQSGVGGISGRAPRVVMGRDSARRRR
jgi:hypothetical protein